MNRLALLAAILAVWAPQTAAVMAAPQVELAQAPRPLVSGERVRVQKLARDMESAMQTLNQEGAKPFQDPAHGEKWRGTVEHFRESLGKYPQVDDPDVKAAAAKLAELENMVAFGINEAAKQNADLGDVPQTLAAIEKALRDHPAPQWLPAPFTEDEARAWAQAAGNAKQVAEKTYKALEKIKLAANLPLNPGTVQDGALYDIHDVDRLMHFAEDKFRKVGEALKQTLEALKTQYAAQKDTLDYYRKLDPANEKDRMNAFLAEGAEAEIYGGLDREMALAQSVVAYQKALGSPPSPASTARIDEIAALRTAYAENRRKALGNSKLPEAKSTDAARLDIARAILANPRYEFGEHGPVVLTTKDIVDREKEVSRAEIRDVDVSLSGKITLSGTETTWKYAWQEFKFAAPLKEADGKDWYVWWITAKKFSSGSANTPIGEWVSGAATKGDLILEENFR
jgi:tetratricopeptide (TPR) repeat protein